MKSFIKLAKHISHIKFPAPECKLFVEFIESTNADDQLVILKNILKELIEKLDLKSIDFLVRVFLEADAKHPVKCFLTR